MAIRQKEGKERKQNYKIKIFPRNNVKTPKKKKKKKGKVSNKINMIC